MALMGMGARCVRIMRRSGTSDCTCRLRCFVFLEVVGHHGVDKKSGVVIYSTGGFYGRGKRRWRMIEVTFLGGVDDGMGCDRRCVLHERVWVGERRRAVVVVLMREAVMWNPSFSSWYAGRGLVARPGTKRTFLSFSLASFASPLPSRASSSMNPVPLTSSPSAHRLSGMSSEVGQGIGPVFLSFRGGSNSLKPFRPSFNPG